MASKKTTRRALFSSVMALILCCAMLVGSTFAWFTDSVSSVNNVITAGNLDVELEYSTDFVTWNAVNSDTNVFEKDTLWEPGHTEVVYLKVSNLGTLALKYVLGVNIHKETGSINVDDEEFKLSNHILYNVVENVTEAYADRDAAVAAAETGAVALKNEYADGGFMEAGADPLYLALVVYMPETVGNEANYKKDAAEPKIELGIDLFATQKDAESDSFGPDYDAGLETSYVSTYEELVEALKSGGKVVLAADIAMTTEETPVVPEGVTVDLDLNGKTLSKSSGNVLLNNGTLTVSGGTLESATAYALNNTGTVTVDDVTFVGGGAFNGGKMIIETADVSNTVSGKHAIYHGGTSLTINGGSFASTSNNEVVRSNSDNVTINGGTFTMIGKSYLLGGNGIVINGGTFNGYVNADGTNDKMRPGVIVNGGTFNFDPAKWLNTGLTAVKNTDGTWTVLSAKYTTVVADGLYSDGNVAYAVTNANGLATLNTKMADKTAGKYVTVELLNDIDFSGKTWTPVDSHADTAFFFSEINGNGHTISNLTVNGQAMFTRLAGSGDVTVKDVTFDNAKVTSKSINTSILTVQTYQNVLLDNVDVINSTITGGYKVAPLIATVYNEGSSTVTATLKNCDVENVTVKATSYDFCTAGMVAFVYADDNDKVEFENCTVSNVTLVVPYDSYKAHAFVYTTGSGSLYDEAEGVTVTNCSVQSYMDGTTTFAGGTLYLKGGTYVTAAEGDNALTITGDTTLVVEGEATLGGGKNGDGIYVAEGVTLTITGDGNLTVYGNSQMEYEASRNYSEYDVPAYANAGGSGIGGENATIIIDGLTNLTAEGYGVNGFGIGGNGSTVTIKNTTIDSVRGGFVNVTGEYIDAKYNKNEPEGGAAIGGKTITIENSHIVEALGGSKAAGIGAQFWQPTDITITNTTIDKVVGGASSAGIGGSRIANGNTAQNTTITIVDSTITAVGGYYGAGIGSGYDTHCQSKQPLCTINITGSTINAVGGKYAAGVGTGYHNAALTGEIKDSTVNAVSGEKFYKDTYTQAQDIGFGVVDPAREGVQTDSKLIYNGVENGIPAVG